MSYIQYQVRCIDCGKEWNTAFGVQGQTIIAAPTTECADCQGTDIIKIADGWKLET